MSATFATSPSPLVSVVIPAYQHAPYVTRAVQSVLEQTVSDLEVIVVDDASTDGTADRVAAIADRRVRLVRLGENRREHARNLGLEMATGRFVAFQNSDDEWLPDKLARQLAVMDERPDVGAVFTEVDLIDAQGAPVASSWADGVFCTANDNRSAAAWLQVLAQRNCFCITSALVRHDLLRRVGGFRPSLLQHSDHDLWVRVAARAGLYVLGDALTRMRILGASNLSAPTAQSSARAMLEMSYVMDNYARPPLLARLGTLFPQAFPGGVSQDPIALLAAFACYLSAGALHHRLFADRTLAGLLDEPEHRARIIEAYGSAVVKCFYERRGEMFRVQGKP